MSSTPPRRDGDLKNGAFIAFAKDAAHAVAAGALRNERFLQDRQDAFLLSDEKFGKLFCSSKEMVW